MRAIFDEEWTQEHGDSGHLSWRLSHSQSLGGGLAFYLSSYLVRCPGRMKQPLLHHRNGLLKSNKLTSPNYCIKKHPKGSSPHREEDLGIWLIWGGGPLCLHFHRPWGQKRRSWYRWPESKCFPEPALESQRTFQKVQWSVSGAGFLPIVIEPDLGSPH